MAHQHQSPALTQRECASKPLTLLTLPQELLDIIFDYAYLGHGAAKHLTPDMWKCRMAQRRTGADLPSTRPFPEIVVDRFFVSKLFFGNGLKSLRKEFARPGSILFEHTSHIRTIACTCFIVMNLPDLKHLTLEIEVRVFDESSEHDALTRFFSKADLKSLPLFRALVKHIGPQHITAVSGSNGSFVWLQNVAALERIVNLTLEVTAPERDKRRVKADQDKRKNGVPRFAHQPGKHGWAGKSWPLDFGQVGAANILGNGVRFSQAPTDHHNYFEASAKGITAAKVDELRQKRAALVSQGRRSVAPGVDPATQTLTKDTENHGKN
ncbi:hypothetical protein LTR78_002419 [Recurvomyces mirabilis]|uniref:Uncharacterized protein n=1 Tax=Recurvomyces mirabilis TaxID=574656 RepID=A0AAE0WT64_9PEZI|nr:hypothetical protein LTR78_002419 [Recurvomyces mirabilis]KAK5157348.1 hypothetical protein LTS14_004113 [Recurvomyces mirabilis]